MHGAEQEVQEGEIAMRQSNVHSDTLVCVSVARLCWSALSVLPTARS
jgi:hypothetical protein